MKKYFIFAAVAAVGLFASCSSDDVASEAQGPIETPDGRVAIQVGVGAPGSTLATRGTGTAGGTGATGDENIWRGERVNVLMYQLDKTTKLPTFNFTQSDKGESLYENTVMVTPLEGENTNDGIAKEATNPEAIGGNDNTYQVKYYPSDGNVQSDFWGYYLGGYAFNNSHVADKSAALSGTLKYYTDATLATEAQTTDAATVVATDFQIDGTHDLLVGQATPADLNATDGHQYSYSAKAARQGIQPNIVFKHLLSRLQFQVKPGKESAAGVKVTGIKVHSKETGNVIVAYKYKDAQGAAVAEPTRIVWDADQVDLEGEAATATTDAGYMRLPKLSLKRRITAADIAASVAVPATYKWEDSDADAYAAAGANQDDTYQAANYSSAVHDNLCLVEASKDKIFKFQDCYKKVVVDQAAIPALTDDDEGKMLALAPVTLTWTGGTPATYKWEDSDENAYTTAKNASADNVIDVNAAYDQATHDATYLVADKFGIIVKFDDGINPVVYKKVVVDQAATGGSGNATKIGEALLVAPQAKYWIEVEYSMDKKTARKWYANAPTNLTPGDFDGDASTIEGTLKADLIRTADDATTASGKKDFAAGESYLITVTLYGPEEIVINTTLTAWTASDQDIEIGED